MRFPTDATAAPQRRTPRFRRAALAGLVALLAACAPAASVAPPAPATPRIVHLAADDIHHVALLLHMEDSRTLDAALVSRLLDDPLPEVRARAALAAGRVRDRAATPLLLRAAADEDAGVRAHATFALGLLADTSAAVLTTLGQLAGAAATAPDPAAEAAQALGLLGGAGRPPLELLLAGEQVPAAVRHAALQAIWRLPRTTGSLTAAARWIDDADAETRWRAAYALWRLGGVESVAPLLTLLADPDDRVRANAVRGLRATVADSAGVRAAALDGLITAVTDAHPHVRVNAVRLLPQYGDHARTSRVLAERLVDEDRNVAVAAAEALGQSGDRTPAVITSLTRVIHDGSHPDGLRAAALAALTRLDPALGMGAASWADSARWTLRLQAATHAGAAGATAVPVLERLARDDHPLVAARAVAALGQLSDSVPAVRRVFLEQLASPHVLVRAAAAAGLGRTAGPADLDPLLLAYQRGLDDPSPEAATAAVNALGRLVQAGVPAERAFFARFGARPPGSVAVYEAIARNIGAPPPTWTLPSARPEPRPVAFYEDLVGRYVAPALAGEPLPQVAIETVHGDVVIELFAADAPLTVLNFLSLVERGYYAGTRWHRVVPNFVLQDGDPRGDGSGGPGYAIRDELNRHPYARGTVGMALSGPDTGGSQFFITHSPQPHLDGGYTVFGRVVSGMDVADRVVQDDPIRAFRRVR